MISSWNIHDFIFKTIFNNWQCSKQMSFFHFEYMYAVSNNLTVLKLLLSVVVMTFFIHNSEKSFETIKQKQFFMFNVSIISVVKFSSNRTIFAIVDFLFKMIRFVFFVFIFFRRWFESEFRKKWFVFWSIFFFKFEYALRRLKRIYVNVIISRKIDFCFFFDRLKSNFFAERRKRKRNVNDNFWFKKRIKRNNYDYLRRVFDDILFE